MAAESARSQASEAGLVRGALWSIGLNTLIPVLLYEGCKRWVSPSEYVALVAATLFPVAESGWGLLSAGELDPIAIVVLLGILVDAIALALGGSPRLLLLRESLFTGAFGLACFVSLALPRPLMFYFGRFFMAGHDAERRQRFDESWAFPEVRRGNRLITSVWGAVLTGELGIRVALVYTLAPAAVLVISPLLLGGLTVGALTWSLRYAGEMRRRVLPKLLLDRPAYAGMGSSIQAPPSTSSS